MARDEPSDDEPSETHILVLPQKPNKFKVTSEHANDLVIDETHALFLPENPIQLPKDGILPVVREGTMGGTPAHQESFLDIPIRTDSTLCDPGEIFFENREGSTVRLK